MARKKKAAGVTALGLALVLPRTQRRVDWPLDYRVDRLHRPPLTVLPLVLTEPLFHLPWPVSRSALCSIPWRRAIPWTSSWRTSRVSLANRLSRHCGWPGRCWWLRPIRLDQFVPRRWHRERPGQRGRRPIHEGGRGKAKGPQDATREALGCFCMLILGAILTLGGMLIILPGLIEAMVRKRPAGLWRSTLIWLVAPAIGIAVVGWLTYGFRTGPHAPPRK